MGLLRLIFAIAVIIAHSSPIFGLRFIGGLMAVQGFYIISGFYMALILNEKYTIGNYGFMDSYKLFITNRLLRLYPLYLIILFATFIISLVLYSLGKEGWGVHCYINNLNKMNLTSLLYIIITNLFILGMDTIMFLKLSNTGFLSFTTNFYETDPQLWHFLLVPQAWSLGVELLFYLIAPFIVRRNCYQVCTLILASLILRIYIYSHGLNHDPWTYRFFPTELTFFLAGTIAYKIYYNYSYLIQEYRKYLLCFIGFFLIFTFLYDFIPTKGEFNMWFYYIILTLTIPALFRFTKDNKLDNLLGELSYPVYIIHFFVINCIVNNLTFLEREYWGFSTAIITIFFSIILIRIIEKPVNEFRQRRLNNKYWGQTV